MKTDDQATKTDSATDTSWLTANKDLLK